MQTSSLCLGEAGIGDLARERVLDRSTRARRRATRRAAGGRSRAPRAARNRAPRRGARLPATPRRRGRRRRPPAEAAFSRAGRRSMRDASVAWTESGTDEARRRAPEPPSAPFSRAITPVSISVARSSSTKNGLPSARPSTSSESDGCQLGAEKRLDQLGGLLRRERLEPEAGGVAPAAGPRRAATEELRPRRAQKEDRAVHVAKQALEQIQQRLLGPVQVLDQHDAGLARRRARRAARPRRRGEPRGPRADADHRRRRVRASAPGSGDRRAAPAPFRAARPRGARDAA